MMRRLGSVIVTSLIVTLVLAPTASATHSTTSPRTFWDANDDWTPDDAIVLVDADGTGWQQTKLDRLNGAVNDWKNNTDFDPGRAVTGNYDFYVDGTQPSCGTFTVDDLMITCQTVQERYNVGSSGIHHYRIVNKDTYTNVVAWNWWFGLTHTAEENRPDFQGAATHEIGHWARLLHVPAAQCSAGTAIETMCATVFDVDDDSWRMRGLTADDIAGANLYYP